MRNYVIIGGSAGIGQAVVNKLVLTGGNIYYSYNSTVNRQKGENIFPFHLNVLDEEYKLDHLPDAIDGLVYSPGAINLKPFHRSKPEEFIKDYELQFLGAIRVIQELLPRLKSSEAASVVLFSTIAVQKGFPFHSIVSASKGAIEGVTRSLAAELAPKIRVNCIAPSLTETRLAERLLNTDAKKASNTERHPLKRYGKPEDIASMVNFLLAEESSWITGQILHVDGGLSAIIR